jgi:hypothetical protein
VIVSLLAWLAVWLSDALLDAGEQAVLWGVAEVERACLRADACAPAAAAPAASGAPPAVGAPPLTADVLEAASILATMPKRGAPPASPVPGAAPMALGAAAAAGSQPAAPAAQAPGDKVKRARSREPSPGTHGEAPAAALAPAGRSAPVELPAWGAKARRR